MRPAKAMILEEAGRSSSMPYISAFSREGAALITLGTMTSPSDEVEAWRSLKVERRRGVGMELDVVLLESVLRFFAIQTAAGGFPASSEVLQRLPCLVWVKKGS
jgi:hypothetical protein